MPKPNWNNSHKFESHLRINPLLVLFIEYVDHCYCMILLSWSKFELGILCMPFIVDLSPRMHSTYLFFIVLFLGGISQRRLRSYEKCSWFSREHVKAIQTLGLCKYEFLFCFKEKNAHLCFLTPFSDERKCLVVNCKSLIYTYILRTCNNYGFLLVCGCVAQFCDGHGFTIFKFIKDTKFYWMLFWNIG